MAIETIDTLTADEEKILLSTCDLRFATDKQSIIKKIIQSVEQLVANIMMAKLTDDEREESIREFQVILCESFELSTATVSIQDDKIVSNLSSQFEDTIDNMATVLLGLDKCAASLGCRAVLLLVDFQEIKRCDSEATIEQVLSSTLTKLKSTNFIFTGSEKTLMNQLMNLPESPLFGLTKSIMVERPSTKNYRKQLNELALNKWGKRLGRKTFDAIMFQTQHHPYYVDMLCASLWHSEELVTAIDVDFCWHKIVNHSMALNSHEVRSLSPNDKKVLLSIASGVNTLMTSAQVSFKLGIAVSSINASLESLIKRDIIDKENNAYYIVNPTLFTRLSLEL